MTAVAFYIIPVFCLSLCAETLSFFDVVLFYIFKSYERKEEPCCPSLVT